MRTAGPKKSKLAAKDAEVKQEEAAEEKPAKVGELGDALPGKARVMVKTFGCSHNISDSEYMAGLL